MTRKLLSLVLAFLLAFPANLVAQVLPDGTTMTSVDYSVQNRTPIVNIAAPSAKGVSHNKFAEYNVGSTNLILNNTKQDGLNSNLGGYISGNPNLIKANKEAQIILNEVTSNKKTALNGYTEILGQKAELIIANPNGISVSGAGFINTSRLSLITGSANILNGGITGFNINQRGKINVVGRDTEGMTNLGLDGIDLDSLNLITRGLILGGDIYAPEINILTGNNQYNYVTGQVSSTEMPSMPGEFAVDASAVGSMYGGRINIVGTEKGFGVRSQGSMVANLDDIRITNNGDVEYKKALAQGDIKVNAANNVKGGEGYANNNIEITAGAAAEYDTLRASNNININANTVNHLHNAEAGNAINITADTLNLTNTLNPASENNVMLSYGDINLNVGILNNGSEIAAFNNVNINSDTLNNNSLILANQDLNLTGGNIFNNKDAVMYSTNNININTDGNIYNTQGDIFGTNGINIAGLTGSRAALLENLAGNIESSAGSISIFAQNINNLSIDNCDPTKETCHTVTMTPTGLTASYWGPKHVIKQKAVVTSNFEALYYGVIAAANELSLNAGDVRNISSKMAAGQLFTSNVDNTFRNESSNYVTKVRDIMQEGWRKRCALGTKFCYRTSLYNGALYDVVVDSMTGASIAAPIIDMNMAYLGNGTKDFNPNLPWANSPINQKLENAANTGVIDPVALTDFGLGGMFKQGNPDGKYLYVTNNRFINIYDFIGSNYFSQQMGLNTDLDGARWLGDPVYEQRLLEKAILDVTGNHYLYDGIASSNDQMKRLYDNAFDAYNSDLGLKFGEALTQEQIAGLTDNIVWYVEQEVNGQKVMVPTLYVSANNADKFLSGAGSTIRGNDININAVDIENSGNIEGKNIDLYASNNIKNVSGVIYGSENVNLEAGNDVIIETKLNTYMAQNTKTQIGVDAFGRPIYGTQTDITYGELPEGHDYAGSGQTSSWLGRTAGVYSGGNTAITAGNDISVKAADFASNGDTTLVAANNITIGTHALDNSLWANRSDKDMFEQTNITNAGSSITTGGNFNVTAGKDATIQGSDITSYGEINLSGENVNIISAVDSSHTYAKTTDSGLLSSTTREWLDDSQTHKGSNITALGDININATNNATILASNLGGFADEAGLYGGSINIEAGNNINILAGQNYEASMRNTEKSAFFGLEGSKDRTYDEIRTMEASSVFAGKDLNLKSGKDTTILASDVGAQGDGNIETGGNFNLLAGIESQYHEEEHWKRSFDPLETLKSAVSSMYDNAFSSADKWKEVAETGRYKLFNVSLYNETTDITKTYDESARAATLNFGGKLNIDAQEDVNIKGSEVYAKESIDISAENINITAQELKSTAHNEHEEKDVSLTAGVSNAYVNTALAVASVVQATEELHKAEQQYQNIKKMFDEGRASQQALDDAKENMEMASVNLAVQTAAATMAAIGAAGSASNSMGTGMQGDVGLNASINKSEFDSAQTTQQGSFIQSGGDITFNAKNNIKQEGSAVVSGEFTEDGLKGGGDISYIAGGDVEIIAAANTYKEKTSSSSESVNLGANTGGTLNVGYSQSNSKSNASDLWWTNSQTMTGDGTIKIQSGGDTTVKGANIQGADVELDVGGNLTVESLQDEHHSSNSNKGWNVGLSFTGAKTGEKAKKAKTKTGETVYQNTTAAYGVSVGYNRSSGESDSAWVNNQTTIIGTNSVTVDADTAHIKGAVIANIDKDGIDKGNLALNTNQLTYEDIKDYNNSYETGFGIQTNFTFGGKTAYTDEKGNAVNVVQKDYTYTDENGNEVTVKKGTVEQLYDTQGNLKQGPQFGSSKSIIDKTVDGILHPDGSTTITVVNKGYEKEQTTHATVGEGEIVIQGETATKEQLDGLNRDIDKAQEITKDQVTGALDYEMTIDHQIAEKAIETTVEGAIWVGEQVAELAKDIYDVVKPYVPDVDVLSKLASYKQISPEDRDKAIEEDKKKELQSQIAATISKKDQEVLQHNHEQEIMNEAKKRFEASSDKSDSAWSKIYNEVRDEIFIASMEKLNPGWTAQQQQSIRKNYEKLQSGSLYYSEQIPQLKAESEKAQKTIDALEEKAKEQGLNERELKYLNSMKEYKQSTDTTLANAQAAYKDSVRKLNDWLVATPGDAQSRAQAENIADKMYAVYGDNKAELDKKILDPKTGMTTLQKIAEDKVRAAGLTVGGKDGVTISFVSPNTYLEKGGKSGEDGMYDPNTKTVYIPTSTRGWDGQNGGIPQIMSTLDHEIMHAVSHQKETEYYNNLAKAQADAKAAGKTFDLMKFINSQDTWTKQVVISNILEQERKPNRALAKEVVNGVTVYPGISKDYIYTYSWDEYYSNIAKQRNYGRN